MRSIHILNGDALADRFPDSVEGERIVARECLCDGTLTERDGPEFWQTRSLFLESAYGIPTAEYMACTPGEFARITDALPPVEWNLWFEDDLFCQVNLWFVCALIRRRQRPEDAFLVRPLADVRYGFAGVQTQDLPGLLERKIPLHQGALDSLSMCWDAFRRSDAAQLTRTLERLVDEHAWLEVSLTAVRGLPRRPLVILEQIQQADPAASFPAIMQAFCSRAPEYGYGDLQVKRLLDQASRIRPNM